MTEPATLTLLGRQILEHWRHHRPKMVESLERGNQLHRAISSRPDGQPTVRTDDGAENRISPGLGDRDEGMGVSPGRGGSAPVVVRSGNSRSITTLAYDLRITPSHGIGEGSLKQKAQANLDAIRTLKAIEAENRPPPHQRRGVSL